jgi:lipoate-protein ligase A
MQLLDLTLPTAEANVALDEALLESAEAADSDQEVLRIWEAPAPMVVIGRSSKVAEEVDRAACEALGVPVLRRSSGGASIVAGPGCLMYAVMLSHARRPELARIDEAHRAVLEPLAAALVRQLPGVMKAGTSDLVFAGRKFSGNSLRCKRQHVLYHGTLLYDFPLDLIGRLLKTPPRQPDYRQGRAHGEFVDNLPLSSAQMRAALLEAFPTTGLLVEWPQALTEQLVREKYALAAWNARL